MAVLDRLRSRNDTAPADTPSGKVLAARRLDLQRLARTRGKSGADQDIPKVVEQSWQVDAWAYFDEIPEVKHAIWFLGNALSKVVFFPTVYDAENDRDVPVTFEDAPVADDLANAAIEELNRLRSDLGGIVEIVREMTMNLEVSGEAWLVGIGARPEQEKRGKIIPATTEQWDIRSVSEMMIRDGKVRIKTGPGDTQGKIVLDPELDTAIRIWFRHPRFSTSADSHMRGVLIECKVLSTLSLRVLAESNSRMSNGAMTVPSELTFGPANPTQGDTGEDAPVQDPFLGALEASMLEPIEDPSSGSAVVPMVIRGPAEYLQEKYLRKLDLGHVTKAEDLQKLIEQHVKRLARGLNLPPETTEGFKATTFANALQIDQDVYEDRIEPRVHTMREALTIAYLRPNLLARGFPEEAVETIGVGADPSSLLAKPNPVDTALDLWDRSLIDNAAVLNTLGFDEDDQPTAEEILQRMGTRKGVLTADLTVFLLQALADEAGVELPEPVGPKSIVGNPDVDGPTGGGEAQTLIELLTAAVAKASEPQQTNVVAITASSTEVIDGRAAGQRLARIDSDLRTRLHQAADDTMARALERAGNRLRSKGGKDLRRQCAGVPLDRIAAVLGRDHPVFEDTVDPDELFDDAWGSLEEQFRAWAAASQDQALDAAAEMASGISGARREALMLRQAESVDEAWEWFEEALQARGAELLFDPDGAIPDVGEFTPNSRVPTGMIRHVMARAGGATTIATDEAGGAFITLGDGDVRPLGGIGTGDTVMDALRDEGVGVEGYVWVYGPALRDPFPGHLALDGVQFEHFDDPALANPDSFPPAAFFIPGDHAGCVCDVEPILIT